MTPLLTVAALAVILAGFSALALLRHGGSLPQRLLETATTANWQVYHDPLGLFTMRLPPGWTASVGLGDFTDGDPLGSDSGQDESIIFSDAALGQASASINVYANPIHNIALAQRMNCTPNARPTTTFNSIPAQANALTMTLFNTENAHFQLGATLPGVFQPDTLGPHYSGTPQPTPSPLPAATVTADRSLLSAALASFQPTDSRPLTCP